MQDQTQPNPNLLIKTKEMPIWLTRNEPHQNHGTVMMEKSFGIP